jgi:hypothetical protein
MSRKHYVAMAESLRFARPEGETPTDFKYLQQWTRDVIAIADVFAADNGRFDRNRFYRAAGLVER